MQGRVLGVAAQRLAEHADGVVHALRETIGPRLAQHRLDLLRGESGRAPERLPRLLPGAPRFVPAAGGEVKFARGGVGVERLLGQRVEAAPVVIALVELEQALCDARLARQRIPGGLETRATLAEAALALQFVGDPEDLGRLAGGEGLLERSVEVGRIGHDPSLRHDRPATRGRAMIRSCRAHPAV